jgi:hypothetical protein
MGLAVSSAITLTTLVSFGMAQSAELDNQVVSVERILEYSATKPEADRGDKEQLPMTQNTDP